jgi:TetR/AcrR family transcriptional repressor of nem operon
MDTRQRDLTRGRILEAAFAEIHRQGFQAASIANILADTGLTKGALYHHFPDKKALGLAVIEEVIRPAFAAEFLSPLRDAAHPLASMRDFMMHKRDAMDAAELALGCPINNLMQEMSPLDADFRDALNRLVEAWRATVRDALVRARALGEVRAELDPDEVALFIVASVWGCIGVAKNLQSLDTFRACLGQLAAYLDTLACGD